VGHLDPPAPAAARTNRAVCAPKNRRGAGLEIAPVLLAALLLAGPAEATQISGLGAVHHDGQTFLTWTSPPGPGWTYRIYRSVSAIESGADLAAAERVGVETDSSWCDRRLSSLSGTVYGFCVDSLAAPLDATQGLFVWTPGSVGPAWYAVTCQAPGYEEDVSVAPGGNALADPVFEVPSLPRPVFQRTLIGPWGAPADVYTLWTSSRETPSFPAMCNRPGEPYDCSIHRGAPGGGLMFHAHVRGGSFYLADAGSGMGGEWQITMDDFIRTPQANTFWFGYHEGYDIEWAVNQPPPLHGAVQDYTARRTIFTLEWARRNFPVDTSRVYVMGASMGGIAGIFLAMWRPDLIAATMVNVPLFDFSFESDPNPLCQFNSGGQQREACDHLWGEVGTGLMMADGTPVYDRLNAGVLAAGLESRFVPPIFAFSGRNDVTIGWAEKIPFYQAMNQHRGGGAFFWDTRDHVNTGTAGAWWPVQDGRYVYRFRTDLSFPALSNCSADGDPGNGEAANGDSVGTINGFMEWDPEIVDDDGDWQVRLKLRDLPTLWGVVSTPESVTVDVTPRRLQRFVVSPQGSYGFVVTRSSDGAAIQIGVAAADGQGVLTIPGVKVYRSGSVLRIGTPLIVGVDREGPDMREALPRIGPLPCPVRGACAMTLDWPGAGERSVELFDLAGRRVRTLFRGRVERGREVERLDPQGLEAGVFVIRARQGEAVAVRRFVLLR
jgi:poly(3-hydroxybutyrate) depolymerase